MRLCGVQRPAPPFFAILTLIPWWVVYLSIRLPHTRLSILHQSFDHLFKAPALWALVRAHPTYHKRAAYSAEPAKSYICELSPYTSHIRSWTRAIADFRPSTTLWADHRAMAPRSASPRRQTPSTATPSAKWHSLNREWRRFAPKCALLAPYHSRCTRCFVRQVRQAFIFLKFI